MIQESDSSPSACRGRFIALVRKLYRFLGHTAPVFQAGDEREMVLELEIDEVGFFVIHSPEHPTRITAYCRMGTLPESNALALCRRLLALNMQLAWDSHATLGMDETSGEIFYMFKANMDLIAPRSFLDTLQQVAREVEGWLDEHVIRPHDRPAAPGHSPAFGFA